MSGSRLGLAFWLVAFLTLPAWSAEFSGKVIGVTDGDTITVLHDRTPVKIRLHGIDCPESGQDFSVRTDTKGRLQTSCFLVAASAES